MRYLDGPNGRIAFERLEGRGPGVVWLGGFRSDMTGTKAAALADWARSAGRAFLRFDYSGHGASDGAFEAGAISDWRDDARAAVERLTEGPQVLVGSSMGGWIALLLAQAIPERIGALVLIAPAPDFTEDLMWAGFSDEQRRTVMEDGRLELPSDSDAPTVVTRRLIEDGRRCRVLGAPVAFDGPVRILQGMADADVPWRHALRVIDALSSTDAVATLVKNGDHRLSTPADIERLIETVRRLA